MTERRMLSLCRLADAIVTTALFTVYSHAIYIVVRGCMYV
jgi:hypothetical protein